MPPRRLQNFLPSSAVAARLKPVPTGSMKTRSVASSQGCSLSTSWYGDAGSHPSSSIFTRRGPSAPRCSQTDAEPGPPLKENIRGRRPPARGFSSVYAMKKMLASMTPFSSRGGIIPAVTREPTGRGPAARGILRRIRNKEDVALDAALLVGERHHPRRHGVAQGTGAEPDGMMGDDRLFLGERGRGRRRGPRGGGRS